MPARANYYVHYFMNLLPLTSKMPHDWVQYVLFARCMSNRPSIGKIKKLQTLQKVVSKFIQSESPFELHPKVNELARYTTLGLFYVYT